MILGHKIEVANISFMNLSIKYALQSRKKIMGEIMDVASHLFSTFLDVLVCRFIGAFVLTKFALYNFLSNVERPPLETHFRVDREKVVNENFPPSSHPKQSHHVFAARIVLRIVRGSAAHLKVRNKNR